eukprot:494987-Hanusia_phi.AAC.1
MKKDTADRTRTRPAGRGRPIARAGHPLRPGPRPGGNGTVRGTVIDEYSTGRSRGPGGSIARPLSNCLIGPFNLLRLKPRLGSKRM